MRCERFVEVHGEDVPAVQLGGRVRRGIAQRSRPGQRHHPLRRLRRAGARYRVHRLRWPARRHPAPGAPRDRHARHGRGSFRRRPGRGHSTPRTDGRRRTLPKCPDHDAHRLRRDRTDRLGARPRPEGDDRWWRHRRLDRVRPRSQGAPSPALPRGPRGRRGTCRRRCDRGGRRRPTSSGCARRRRRHRAAVDAALASGRAVFCEKPLDRDLSAARALADAAVASGVPTQSGLVLRSAPVFRALRDLVPRGTLGAPMAAIFRDDQFFPIQGHYASQWRADVAQAGGGCLIEHSIHDVDILRFCFGEVHQISAQTAQLRRTRGDRGPGHRVAELRVGFRGAAHERLARHLEPGLDPTHRSLLPGRHGVARRRIPRASPHSDRHGSRGTAIARHRSGSTRCRSATTRSGLAVRTYVEADRDFVEAVTAGRSPEPSLADAVEAHRLVDAAYRSAAADGAPITLG